MTAFKFRELAIAGSLALSAPALASPDNTAMDETAGVEAAQTPPIVEDFSISELTGEDAALYERIFEVQEGGDWKTANRLIQQVENDVLMGHVKYQRYMHPTDYRSTYSELKNWMSHYADHPNASKIYRLAVKRRPANYRWPDKAEPRRWRQEDSTRHPAFEALNQSSAKKRRVRQAERHVRSLLRRERPTQALNYINSPRIRQNLADIQYDRIRAWIAASYFYERVDAKAAALAAEIAASNGDAAPLSYWVGGIVNWRNGNQAEAAEYFEKLAHAEYISEWLVSAGGYWGARANLALGQPEKVTPLLEAAAEAPLTFYGQLALRQLGRDFSLRLEAPELTAEDYELLTADAPAVRRGVALAEAKQYARAEAEMRRVHGVIDPSFDRALFATAHHLNLPTSQLEIARAVGDPNLEAGLFPLPDYAPTDGFTVDRALIYAFMRQESKFIPTATSYVGARGLMQLMPRTAGFIAKDRTLYRYRSGRNKLYDPEFNLSLGQRYLEHLMATDYVGPDLFKMTVAYNGGPGNLRRWMREMPVKDDPLLFIESIPNQESRNFIEQVLTNLWVYRSRLGEPTPSLDAVAAGGWPIYTSLETAETPEDESEPLNTAYVTDVSIATE